MVNTGQKNNTAHKRIKQHQNRIYANPLPVLIDQRPSTFLAGLSRFGQKSLINPSCVGIYIKETQSVWVINERDIRVLWTRGFFGKGSLSRSEPTWNDRQRKLAVGDKPQPTAEEITSKRRVERNKMKIERAKVLTEAQLAAEAALAGIDAIKESPPVPVDEDNNDIVLNDKTSRGFEPSSPPKWEPLEPDEQEEQEDLSNAEHLQLTLQEAFFLAWGVGCLRIIDPQKDIFMSNRQLWKEFRYLPITLDSNSVNIDRLDNPFLVNYAVYHHYRSLGWVIKSGIKFCVDMVLYKRGPVFHHAEFAVVICPTYEDEADKSTSPFKLHNTDELSWQWLNTINRVNSQAKKTLILAYVEIPSKKRVENIDEPTEVLKEYNVKEVVIKRFVAARNRDN
ncbi:hypothetical protein WALSEDRAFT_70304 [Wallemia mellicola CBS 633.66]|uniref:tRNA-splicing endonuclease subunit Sen2 n=2 Tax=Wallemia mellicola TaxID=1708541 RepID=A0A4T0LEF5_9BASI|nr:hypothetical protein WALSEDRAFT_70304 [Wallemia mellicola CBS 633.66]TIB67834.1 hypothetical protein E3Q24_03993 [Wallemia mellicola]EIM19773.1 hypothetical protein WALSEDRAFT_70304 [Wallemia mellicola CBS 633.66]TIB70690.1 hypothetical protein E3Q23_04091 [Wallemia mellicola]TIB79806.1 hypothetical protein E3Q21_04050 [Wallemia mellicola]TIB83754.1 hypothetical protein E3Q20_04003 [Wallemia mellicola]|eukprot:XP_006960108.1 hypothetical protein WALSEDRAFT_70304 [Wallemia mellicola CBS 633.66]